MRKPTADDQEVDVDIAADDAQLDDRKSKPEAPPPPRTDDPALDKSQIKDGALQPLPAAD